MALAKTQDINVLTIQQVAAAGVVNSSVLNVEDYLELFIAVQIGRDNTTGLTVGVIVRIQGSPKSAGDDCWQDIRTYQTNITAAADEAVSGTCNAGQATIAMAATAGFVVGDLILIKNSTIANSEFHRVKTVTTNTSVVVDDTLTNAQTGSTCYDQAEKFVDIIPVISFCRLRIQIDNAGNATPTIVAEAKASAGTI